MSLHLLGTDSPSFEIEKKEFSFEKNKYSIHVYVKCEYGHEVGNKEQHQARQKVYFRSKPPFLLHTKWVEPRQTQGPKSDSKPTIAEKGSRHKRKDTRFRCGLLLAFEILGLLRFANEKKERILCLVHWERGKKGKRNWQFVKEIPFKRENWSKMPKQ